MGYYAEIADIENEFGKDNILTWSNLDNEVTTRDDDRCNLALANADSMIDAFFRTSEYPVPLPKNDTTKRWAAIKAGVWLHGSRGAQESDDKPYRYSARKKEVDAEMLRYRSGAATFAEPGARVYPSSPAIN